MFDEASIMKVLDTTPEPPAARVMEELDEGYFESELAKFRGP
jgi:hypothetical protein